MPALNEEKYRNAILFFVEQVDATTLGKVKLMKLLYYLDYDHLEQFGALVTGDYYRALQMGPVPESAASVMSRMETDGWLRTLHVEIGPGYSPKEQYAGLRPHDPTVFSPTEMEVLSNVVLKWGHHTKQEMVNATHGEPTWMYTAYGEIIDPRLVYLRNNMDFDNETSAEEEIVRLRDLTPEEARLRSAMLASVARTEDYARKHPEFLTVLQAAVDEVLVGEYDTFGETGWQD